MNQLPELALSLIPLLATTAAVVAVVMLLHWLLLARHSSLGKGRQLPRQLAMLGATIAGLVLVVLALPVGESTRNQVLTLIGLLLSGVIAFSSTAIVANLMAGVVLRMTQPFHTGDFIHVGEVFGRVSERGLFDTEIQTERRELVSLTNSYLLANPVTVILSSGTLISAEVSLGYDVHHARVRALLLQAAQAADLSEPFVQVMELADHAVVHRVNGLLTEVKSLITARSNLNRAVLDALHGDGIEIVSPTFMNQRQLPPDGHIIPAAPKSGPAPAVGTVQPEDVMFDKAEAASQRAQTRRALKAELRGLEAALKEAEGEARDAMDGQITALREQLAQLEQDLPPGDDDDDDEATEADATERPPAPPGPSKPAKPAGAPPVQTD